MRQQVEMKLRVAIENLTAEIDLNIKSCKPTKGKTTREKNKGRFTECSRSLPIRKVSAARAVEDSRATGRDDAGAMSRVKF